MGRVAAKSHPNAATNIASRTGPSATYAHDQANRVTSDGAQAFTWDGADRLVQRGSDTFTYDPLARLTNSTVAGTTRTYSYDGDGLLRSGSDSGAIGFLWDTSIAPSPLVEAGADRVVQGLGPLYIVRIDGSTLSLARDGLGSVRAEQDNSGALVASFRYSAYGEIAQANAAGATPTLLGYTGEFVDSTGFVYLRARWYDPSSARFLTRDAFPGDTALPQSLNAYSYGAGSPTRYTDPNGNCVPFCLAVLANPFVRGAVIGAAGYTLGYLGARLVQGNAATDFDARGLLLATVAGAVTGGFGAAAPVAGRVLLGAGVSGGVEEATQLLENRFSPERLLVATTFGAFSGLFRADAFPAAIGLNILLQTDKRLSREFISPRPGPTGFLGVPPGTSTSLLSAGATPK